MTMIEIENLKKTREYKAAMALEDALNDTCFNYEKFAQSVQFMHPTLQQSLFRLIRAVIKEQAREDRYFDGRNQASHEMAKKLFNTLENECVSLPYI